MTESQIRRLLERAIAKERSAQALAHKLGISPQFLSDVRRGLRAPSDKILAPLGLERVITYRKRKPACVESETVSNLMF